MSNPVLTVLDKDLSSYVLTWGSLEAIRKLKLSDSTLFSSRFSITLDNTKGYFTPGGAHSIFPRTGWAGGSASVVKDGLTLFEGFIWDLSADDEASNVSLELSTSMTDAANTVASLTGTGLNPAQACLSLLEQAGLTDKLNRASFSVAAGLFGTHVISVTCGPEQGETCLSLASKIADVCSLDFVLVQGIVYCVPTRDWQGEGLRQELNGSNTRSFKTYASDAVNFCNRVDFTYGANLKVTVNNLTSQNAERRVIASACDATNTSTVQVVSEADALFFANLLLKRLSPRRMILEAVLQQDFTQVLPTWRYPVTYPLLGLASTPFEVNEAQQDLDLDQITVKLQTLEAVQ